MKRLKILPWFLALALILVIVYSTGSRDFSPGTRVDASLVFHDRQPAVQAMINGKGPYLLLIYPTRSSVGMTAEVAGRSSGLKWTRMVRRLAPRQ